MVRKLVFYFSSQYGTFSQVCHRHKDTQFSISTLVLDRQDRAEGVGIARSNTVHCPAVYLELSQQTFDLY